MLFDALFSFIVSKQNVFALCLILRIQSSKTQGMALNSSSCCYVICKFTLLSKRSEFYVLCILCAKTKTKTKKQDKYCSSFLQSCVCVNSNKTCHRDSSCLHMLFFCCRLLKCSVKVAKDKQADPMINLWPLCIDQSGLPCCIVFLRKQRLNILSLNYMFK